MSKDREVLQVWAGKKAYRQIKDNGLQPSDVFAMAGAAGGPKWIVLQQLDKWLFGEWFAGRKDPLYLMGSSAGSWRFAAALAFDDPIEGLHRFKEAYFSQVYSGKPTPEEVSRLFVEATRDLISPSSARHILEHPYGRLAIFTARAKGLMAQENLRLQGLGFLMALLTNAVGRNHLGYWFQRVVFQDPRIDTPLFRTHEFDTRLAGLNVHNFTDALMGSSAIPMVLAGVKDIAGGPPGIYRDGGMTDYHMALPYLVPENKVVLLPHFFAEVIPGWLDKYLKNRKPLARDMEQVVLICPTEAFIRSLPGGKIPDRKDFEKLSDQERLLAWEKAYRDCTVLGDTFASWVLSGEIRQKVQRWELD